MVASAARCCFGTARGYRLRSHASRGLAYGTVGIGKWQRGVAVAIAVSRSPLLDPMFDARRVDAPAYPVEVPQDRPSRAIASECPRPVELSTPARSVDFRISDSYRS
jgi:hypothetical protein